MRIFYAAHDQGNHQYDSLTWYNNLYLPLCDIADEVIRFQYDLYNIAMHQDFVRVVNEQMIGKEKSRIEFELLKQIKFHHKQKPIDVFFSYFSSAYCSRELIEEIKGMGIITINWFCNASYQFYLIRDLAPAYDFCLVPEKFMMESYKKIGANPIYCQEAANPKIYKFLDLPYKNEVSFVGGRYADRYTYIKAIYDAKFKLKVWGENWRKEEGRVRHLLRYGYHLMGKGNYLPNKILCGFADDDQMIDAFNTSKINLGFSMCGETHLSSNPVKQVRLRDFEVPMSGGFYLTEYNEELKEFFEEDEEIVFFKDKEECLDKIKYYLNHDMLREKIRMSGYIRAQRDHTWQKRLGTVFNMIKNRQIA